MKDNNRGFTLIELLIVVAIIGLLITIILVSLNNARGSAKDTRILSSLEQLRNVAQDFFTKNNTYNGLTDDYLFGILNNDIKNMGGVDPVVAIGGNKYCFYTELNSGEFCCIDDNLTYKCFGTDALLINDCKANVSYKCE